MDYVIYNTYALCIMHIFNTYMLFILISKTSYLTCSLHIMFLIQHYFHYTHCPLYMRYRPTSTHQNGDQNKQD